MLVHRLLTDADADTSLIPTIANNAIFHVGQRVTAHHRNKEVRFFVQADSDPSSQDVNVLVWVGVELKDILSGDYFQDSDAITSADTWAQGPGGKYVYTRTYTIYPTMGLAIAAVGGSTNVLNAWLLI